ncbi:PEP-CTERM sorting domain-containing protein [Massilia sp. BJB1822]|uniref:PEP-CTERM sorting domain-containing protein n=1 Tax=Massilia sp. BJB1822 TaxID=2744470 RepID=UPI001594649A|nr:PEP-CTERM sorting domain-containing protein [Massilia sp. BJB1822]NVE00905.1 PEP-CTERM sorting domain-containing protein [Massilia sp. BJB1822]
MKTLTALICLMLALPAKAALVTYNFTAKISSLTEQLGNIYNPRPIETRSVNGELISLGYTVKGSFTYDTSTRPSQNPIPLPQGVVMYSDFTATNKLDFSFNQNNLHFTSAGENPYQYIIVGDGSMDGFSFSARIKNNASTSSAYLFLSAYEDIFSSNGIPENLPASRFTTKIFSYTFSDFQGATSRSLTASGEITSLELTSPVPEPSSYAMFLAGLAVAAFAVRRRQTNS